jgi:hypothetical protein
MPPQARWPRARRLDAQAVADAIQAAAGLTLRVAGPCPGGQVGAAYVTWPDGHRSVLTWQPGIGLASVQDGPLAVIGALRPPVTRPRPPNWPCRPATTWPSSGNCFPARPSAI